MPLEASPGFSYDEFPYASYPYANSHPRNLAALAQLFAMAPADVNRCRVLEIGSAAGGNLIPMAVDFPESEFLGIDASSRQIDDGKRVIRDLSLANITLRRQDILDFDASEGEFDFIICHGVYSWVPPDVQAKILAVCRQHLSEHGVAYISYNTYPGWYLRRGVREMMNFHAAGFDDTQTKINQARALVDFLAGAVQPNQDAYEKLLHEELSILRASEDSYIFHEHLENYNEPLFFHEFVSRAEKSDLRFVCEAQFGSMIANECSDETRRTLAEIAPDIIQMEQYLDFLRNRKFRQTLLCHREVKLSRAIEPDRLKHLHVNSPLILQGRDDDSELSPNEIGAGLVFEHASGQTLTVANAIQAHAFKHLADIWPCDIPIDELAHRVCNAIEPESRPSLDMCRQELYETLLELYSSSIVALFSARSACIPRPSEIPQTSSLIRYQADSGHRVTNLRHESVQLDDFEREIVKRLDGVATIDKIADELLDFDITLTTDVSDTETQATPTKPSREDLCAVIRQKLTRFAQTGLLIA